MVVDVATWAFNVFEYSEVQLLVLAKHMFGRLNLVRFSRAPIDVWESFLVAVKQSFNDNPYHNWRHAFDSMQAAFVFLVRFSDRMELTPLEQLGLLIASLCQDLGHPGCNNDFMVKTETEVAALYNHRSVLENCHSFMLCQMLDKREDLNVLAALAKEDQQSVKKIIMECILSTDSGGQIGLADKLKAIEFVETRVAEHRLSIMQCIVKMADASNVARDWESSLRWSCLASEEMFNQGDALRLCGINVPVVFDRNETTMAKNTKDFIDSVALPLGKALGRLFPKFNREVVPILSANRTKWVKFLA